MHTPSTHVKDESQQLPLLWHAPPATPQAGGTQAGGKQIVGTPAHMSRSLAQSARVLQHAKDGWRPAASTTQGVGAGASQRLEVHVRPPSQQSDASLQQPPSGEHIAPSSGKQTAHTLVLVLVWWSAEGLRLSVTARIWLDSSCPCQIPP